MKSQADQFSRNRRVRASALIAVLAALAMLLMSASAGAASPVLEFVAPGHSLPVGFTTESGAVNAEMAGLESLVHCTASQGEGQITGPRSTVSEYRFTGCTTERGSHEKCKSAGAQEEEITTGPIEADLVYIDQAKREVGVLLNPGGGTYMTFECGGVSAEGQGSFLAPVSPLNQAATSFTATLSQFDSVQTPDAYEGEKGETLQAVPRGKKGSNKLVPTGVEATFTVHTSVPVEVKAVTVQELEAKQLEAEIGKHEEAFRQQEATLKNLEKAFKSQEEALARAEAHAKKVGEEAKKQEEEAAAEKAAEEKAARRARLLAHALRQCSRQPKGRRARCKANARKKYGSGSGDKAGARPAGLH